MTKVIISVSADSAKSTPPKATNPPKRTMGGDRNVIAQCKEKIKELNAAFKDDFKRLEARYKARIKKEEEKMKAHGYKKPAPK